MPEIISPGDLILKSVEVYKKHFNVFADFAVWFAVLGFAQWSFDIMARSLLPDRFTAAVVSQLLSIPLALLLMALLAAMIDVTARAVQKKNVNFEGVLAMGMHKLIPFLWVTLLSAAAVFFGLILLVIPAFIFFVWYRYATYITVVDDVRGFAALQASKKLVSGRFWPVALRMAIPWLFFYVLFSFAIAVIYLLLGAAFGDPGLFFGNIGSRYSIPAAHSLVITLVPQIVSGLSLPLFMAADLALWYDLKK
ncbi:hypothetical protein HY633_03945 [Candidatus Uhrbacteria bacterium]|nr:hypothetical protein [Candidatus Uhrbacteria bacterium]